MNTKRLRQAEKKNIPQIRDFLTGRNSSLTYVKQLESRLDMLWIDNPAMDAETPPGWIIEDSLGKIVGFIANIPVPYQIFGKKDTAVASSSWYVKPEARGMISLQLLQSFLRQQGKKHKTAALRIWARDQDLDTILKQWFKTRRKYDYLYYYKLNAPNDIRSISLEQYKLLPSPIDPERGAIAFYSSLYS